MPAPGPDAAEYEDGRSGGFHLRCPAVETPLTPVTICKSIKDHDALLKFIFYQAPRIPSFLKNSRPVGTFIVIITVSQ
jgi:hypothetical protein